MPAAPAVVVSLPETDPLSEDQAAKVSELLEALRQRYGSVDQMPPQWRRLPDDDERRVLAYKYLTARKWKRSDAERMIVETAEWRAAFGLDDALHFPCAFPTRGYDDDALVAVLQGGSSRPRGRLDDIYKKISRHYSCNYHFWDKEGHPVVYEQLGRTRIKGLFKAYAQLAAVGSKPTDVALEYHRYQNEVAAQLVKFRDATRSSGGRRIRGFTAVIDASGLGYHMLVQEAVDILRTCFSVDASFYPEALHRVLVVNCPALIAFAYKLLSPAIDKRTQSKIAFCKPHETIETLKLVIDDDKIPEHLGGSCRCPGGCVVELPRDEEALEVDEEPVTEDVKIKAGEVFTKNVAMTSGEHIAWEFLSTTSHDVSFSAKFHPRHCDAGKDGGASVLVVVAEPSKINAGEGDYTAPVDGILCLSWDNTHSWMKTKRLQLRVQTIKAASGGS